MDFMPSLLGIRRDRDRSIPISVFVVFSFSVMVTLLTWWKAREINQRTIAEATVSAAEHSANDISTRLDRYQFGLRGVRGAIITGGETGIKRDQFQRYSASRNNEVEFPGARGFGFIRRVPVAQEAQFLAAARRDGMPDFAIRQLAPHDGERFVIQYIEPAQSNMPAIGLDIASEANRSAAAWAAIRDGEARLSGPITLVQVTGKPRQSFLFLLPIYRTITTPPDVKGREAAAYGWSYAPISIQDILANSVDVDALRLTIKDINDATRPSPFFESGPPIALPMSAHSLEREVYGRVWRIGLETTPAFLAKLPLLPTQLIALVGGLLSVLLSITMYFWVEQLRRKRVLSETQLVLAAIVESSNDGIIGKTLAGVVFSWNRGAESIFGYTAQEAIGRPLAELIVPDALLDEEASILSNIGRGEYIQHFRTQRRRKDGGLIAVSVSVSPILGPDGAIKGASKTVRDISAQKAAEDAIQNYNADLEREVAVRTVQLDTAQKTLRTVLDALPSMIGYWDKQLINRVANHAYSQWFGLDHHTLPGKPMQDVLGTTLFELNRPYIEGVLAGQPQTFEREIKRPDGTTRYSLAHYMPDRSEAGLVEGFYVIVHDVTEQTQALRRLKQSMQANELLLRTINQHLLYSETDASGVITEVNDHFCSVHGYAREEVVGQSHSLLQSGQHPAEFWQSVWSHLKAGKTWRGEICNRAKDGSLRWFDSVFTPHLHADGAVDRYIALRVDITDRKASDKELARLNLMFSSVLDSSTEVSIIATDTAGLITVFNTGAQRMLGYTEAEMVGLSTPARFHLEEEVVSRGQALSVQHGVAIEGFAVFTYAAAMFGSDRRHWTYVRKDGTHLTVSLTVTAIRDADGTIKGYLGIATDVTQQLKHQHDLAAARDQLLLAARVAGLGVWTWTIKTNALQWNSTMYDIYAQPPELEGNGLEYSHWRSRIHPEDVAATEGSLLAAVEGRGEYAPKFRVVRPDGSVRHVQANAYIERDELGNATRVTGINLDISDRHEFETKLLEAKQIAEESSVAKGQFLANMSHEIRTPMNAVLGMLQLLRQTPLSDRQTDYAAKAQTAARSLLGLLNDILDFSKIDAGKMQLDVHPFDVEGWMSDLAVVLSGNVGDKNIELMFDVDPDLPSALLGDRLRLQQIMINLAGNAIKFTHEGHVIVGVTRLSGDGNSINLRISVADTGIGISPQQLQRIFAGFTQAEASTTRKFGGTGLGLVISKRLVELMGGELCVHSEPGKGTRFWFDIALSAADAAPILDTPLPVACKPRILVADDNAVSGEIFTSAIQSVGWEVAYVDSGAKAVVSVENAIRLEKPYDVVLMDWRMPGMDGVAAASAIRDIKGSTEIPVVIMVSAFGREVLSKLEAAPHRPFAEFLTKPVTPQQLIGTILRVMGAPDTRAPTPVTPRQEQQLDGVHILVVEDNALNRQVANELLLSVGAQVSLAEGGIPGVAMVIQDKVTFDIVLMDLQMPDIDGFEATRRIRADTRFVDLPILAMTANVSASDRDACLVAGMNEHIGKPIDIDTLTPMVLKLLGRAAQGGAQASVQAVVADMGFIEPLDNILRRMGGRRSIYSSVLAGFESECQKLIDEVRAHRQHGGTALQLSKTMHALKGMAGTAGATALAELAKGIGAQAKSAGEVSAAQLISDDLLQKMDSLVRESDLALKAAFGGEQTAKPLALTDSAEFDTNAYNRDVARLLELLTEGNMAALDVLEKMAASPGYSIQAGFAEMAAEVRNLQFDAAAVIAKSLFRY